MDILKQLKEYIETLKDKPEYSEVYTNLTLWLSVAEFNLSLCTISPKYNTPVEIKVGLPKVPVVIPRKYFVFWRHRHDPFESHWDVACTDDYQGLPEIYSDRTLYDTVDEAQEAMKELSGE